MDDKKDTLRSKRGEGIAAMGLVTRAEDGSFQVQTPSLKGRIIQYEVRRDENSKVICSCLEFQEHADDSQFRCEHIYAVKHHLLAKPTMQKENEMREELHIRDVNTLPADRDYSIASIIRRLKEPIPPDYISPVEKGGGVTVNTVNITDAKDLLDDRVGEGRWTASIESVNQIGAQCIMVVRAFIYATDGTFHNDGTGCEEADLDRFGDTGSNAFAKGFKRAFESFGFARELWRDKGSNNSHTSPAQRHYENKPPAEIRDPLAKSMADLVTPKQLSMIRAIGREIGVDVEEECQKVFKCKTDELSKRAGSSLIDHLKALQGEAAALQRM